MQGRSRRGARAVAESREPEGRKIMARRACERQVRAQQAADRPQAEAMPRKAGRDDESGNARGSVEHGQRIRREIDPSFPCAIRASRTMGSTCATCAISSWTITPVARMHRAIAPNREIHRNGPLKRKRPPTSGGRHNRRWQRRTESNRGGSGSVRTTERPSATTADRGPAASKAGVSARRQSRGPAMPDVSTPVTRSRATRMATAATPSRIAAPCRRAESAKARVADRVGVSIGWAKRRRQNVGRQRRCNRPDRRVVRKET